ncbi:hypothetical protein N7481_009870 [Penicillium waksmanii]|uniref:uncharacterized protein n=1 Tax=Penicillium waksmanii TaxID=69791 RepID=UPI00254822A2|nr:uncharacterized protein N7481_009870 [Penicillium waksmanii]KAJ5976163.1 hypothetical protein N7481_009870 [Penicillium waksmanii]
MATNISRALLLSATANTATPFLYQTRTLGPVLRSFQRPCTPRLQRTYSTRTDDLEVNDETDASITTEEPASKDNASPEPRRSHLRKRGSSAPRHSASASASPDQFKSVTSREKAAFNKLLTQLNDDSSFNSAGKDVAAPSTTGQNAKQNDVADLMKLFRGIVNLNAQPKTNTAKPSVSENVDKDIQIPDGLNANNQQSETPIDSDEIEPVNEAIYTREELGLPPPRSGVDRQISMREAVALVVHQETYRIERALFEAIEGNKGDIAVWEVCKTHIFSMLRYMEGQTDSAETPTTATSDNSVVIPPMIPAGRVITTLYPRALLMTFRLLNTHFPESQLISQFRASIKAQGRASALLGASPELYHEIVHFYWNGCRDLPAVMSFLQDMDLHGVQPSRETLGLLRSIEQQGKSHLRSRSRSRSSGDSCESGQRGSPFWDLPPNQKALTELCGKGGWLESHKKTKRPVTTRRGKLF